MKLESKFNNCQKALIFEKRKKLGQLFTFYFLLFTFTLLLSGSAFGQDEEEEFPEYIPPPKIELSKDEKTALADEKDTKKNTKLAIDLMDARLKKAEELTTNQQYNDVLQELGGFHALMNATMQFLRQNDSGRGKNLNNFKRYEMALRSFMPRLETIRREVPERHENYVIRLLKLVRENRTKAIQPLFGETVLPDEDN